MNLLLPQGNRDVMRIISSSKSHVDQSISIVCKSFG